MTHLDYFETWKEVVQKPSDFYREMPKTGGYFYPMVFAAINIAIYFFLSLIFNPDEYDFRDFSPAMMVMAAIMIPIIATFALFIDATLLYFIQKALGGKGTYEGTAKIVLYSSATALFLWIPLVGWLSGIYQLYLYIVGGKYVCGMSMERSALVVFTSILLVIVLIALISISGFI